MKKISIGLYVVLLFSILSFSIMSVYAEPIQPGDTDNSSVQSSESVESSESSDDTNSDEDTSSEDVDDSNSETYSDSSSEDESSMVESDEDDTESKVISKPTSSSVSSKEPAPYEDEGYDYGLEDIEDGDYTQVTSESLSQSNDLDGDGVDDEEEKDSSVSKRIARVIWIPITLAILSAGALVIVNMIYRKKYGKLNTAKKKKKKATKIYIPRD